MNDALLVVHGRAPQSDVLPQFERVAIDGLGSPAAREAGVFLLHTRASGDALEALRVIREHRLPSIYLKPVVLVSDSAEAPGYLGRAVDGVWDFGLHADMPPGLADRVTWLEGRAGEMAATAPEGDSQLSFRVLRFVASREETFVPEPTIHSPSGFQYPPLDAFVARDDGGSDVGEILASLELQRVVEGAFSTKAYACTHCSSGFLNFLEICPDCGSADLRVDDTVHHFRCGYVAPHRDFIRGDQMVCPKCSREMQHIGVDYDKPSLVYDCNECQNRFPQPDLTTTCFRCRRVTPPEMQVHRTVKSYSITPFGENAALYGLDSLFVSVLQQKVVVFDYNVFKQFLDAEKHRIERYKRSESCLIVLSFSGIENIYAELGSRGRELLEEVTVAFKTVLRPSDIVTVRNESLFIVLAPETHIGGAERSVERLREATGRLFDIALKNPPSLSATIRAVDATLDVDALVAEVMEELDPDPDRAREAGSSDVR